MDLPFCHDYKAKCLKMYKQSPVISRIVIRQISYNMIYFRNRVIKIRILTYHIRAYRSVYKCADAKHK